MFFFSVKITVYLRADLDTLEKHIKKRNRKEERNIKPEFLQGLQDCHEDLYFYQNSTFNQELEGIRIVSLNAALSLEEFKKEVIANKDFIIPPNAFDRQ